ncbi:P-loop containing nucleoside triphosphate hydrolase protein [Massarina eburnea CBS 473.64]|uniref:P-loop containing nucleoside triphosphate hydrolase protein n=1 Tax=Massarina eburnea CBS 473.64 TaxID=1395130 RepID=A0A6A6RQ19_9PLEO|nr:P-loop containing nucleoside triphosphate hydrolase protein [Massarina eburnea CBS 473.64]
MPRLKAATVSDQMVRKRKRNTREDELPAEPIPDAHASSAEIEDEVTTTTKVPTKTHDGGKKPKRTPKKNLEGRPTLVQHGSSTVVETSIPWPEHFTKLAQVYRALNLVYTFCCTRKHLATTLDNLRSTVEGQIQRKLVVEDVAQITALVPKTIRFAYVDEAMLQINLMGSEENVIGKKARDFVIAEPELDKHEHKEVLLFEFVDGDLKRQVQDAKTGEPTKAVQKLRNEDLKMPVFSQKQMMKLIEKRNNKFTSAVNAFLNRCHEQGIHAAEELENVSVAFTPVPSKSRSSTPGPERSLLPTTIPTERKAIPEIIEEVKTLEWYTGQIVPDGHRVFDPQPPIYGDLNFQMTQGLVNALYNTRNIERLYAHQAEAINNLYDGHNVIVSTSTSSGKSLIYQIPVLHQLEQDINTRAMYIFPTKALAQDQRRSLKEMLRFMDDLQDIVVETFDGDTPMADRNHIRDEARIIFTNPDMLHITILPQEEAWRTFLQNLKFVVVDELHVYNGLFGAHVALIMRRLRRICAAVGNRHVKFISCSATVANPEEHMKTIFGVEEVKLTDFDGSPSGRKEFLCWNTPFKDPGDPTSGRGNTLAESAKLFCQLILRGVRVIAFCRIRKQCEALLAAIKTELQDLERPEVIARVMSYRGGYTPQDRRQIEREMFDGKLVGIVATSALELGVDIGSLDAVLTIGFPYTIANLRQQSGRAGRRNKDSLSVLVGDCFPTDQFYMSNPDEIFTKPNCALQVDLENLLVLEGHIQCAAYEMPVNTEADITYFGPLLPKLARERMRKDTQGFYHCNERFLPLPSRHVAIRDTEDTHFAIIDITNGKNTVLEELEASRAFFTIYEGGIFLHQGNTYLIKEFSPERMLAKVEFVKVDWTTQQRDYTDIDPVETEAIRRIPNSRSRAFYGPIKIQQVVFGFFKIDKKRRILDAVEVDNPPIILLSKGMWLDVPKSALDILKEKRLNIAAAIHASEHAVLSLMPNFVISMPGDVRTECKVALKEFAKKETSRKRPARLTFYDAKGGASGSGIKGCLECCCDERCKEANQVMSKAGALVIIMCLLGKEKEIDVEALPFGDEEAVPAGIETVVQAEEVRMVKGRFVQGVWVKNEDEGLGDEFGRSIRMFGGGERIIGVHR